MKSKKSNENERNGHTPRNTREHHSSDKKREKKPKEIKLSPVIGKNPLQLAIAGKGGLADDAK